MFLIHTELKVSSGVGGVVNGVFLGIAIGLLVS